MGDSWTCLEFKLRERKEGGEEIAAFAHTYCFRAMVLVFWGCEGGGGVDAESMAEIWKYSWGTDQAKEFPYFSQILSKVFDQLIWFWFELEDKEGTKCV